MTQPATISADYTLRPSELAEVLALLIEARQPCIVWGPPGAAKSQVAQQVAATASRRYVDVRALLLDPVDLRGIPWRDGSDRTRWAPPAFLPPSDDPGRWLINLEELPSAVPMVQAALYQLVLDRKVGEYELPEGASLIACGNRETDRGVVHRMPTPLASRFVHLEIRVDAEDWLAWGAANGIAAEVLFFITYEPDLLHVFDPKSTERAFPTPRTWEFASNIVKRRNGLDPEAERAMFRGTVGEAAAVEFAAFLKVWRELPHPRAIVNDPENADIPKNASALMALCGALYKLASDVNFDAIVTYAQRLRREVGESLVGACVRREPTLYRCPHYERPLIGYEWRRLDRAPMRRACRAGVCYLGGSTWMRDTDWPSYNHNDGQYAGMPRTLRKLWERCPWAHTPETRPERPCPLLDGIEPESAHET